RPRGPVELGVPQVVGGVAQVDQVQQPAVGGQRRGCLALLTRDELLTARPAIAVDSLFAPLTPDLAVQVRGGLAESDEVGLARSRHQQGEWLRIPLRYSVVDDYALRA